MSWKRGIAGVTLTALLGLASLAAGGRAYEFSQASAYDEALTPLLEDPLLTQVEVYDSNGDRFDSFGLQRRFFVGLDEVSEPMKQAVVAAEDRRFWTHSGVDPIGVSRAMVANFQAGTIVEGGSTLTQQLVKQGVVGDAPTYERKLEEALLARQLERRLGKEGVLERYLNTIYLGSGNYGVEAAARDYFGKNAADLDYAEAATLTAMIPAPSTYDPRRHPEMALKQRSRILGDLVETGVLSAVEASGFEERPLLGEPMPMAVPEVGDAYRTVVRRQVRDLFPGDAAYELGLKIETPFDPSIQAVAEKALVDAMDAVYERQDAELLPDRTAGDWLTGAAVVIDNEDGGVLALASGADMSLEGFNQATQAKRQPGSTFKPYVYGAALESGMTQLDDVLDAPVRIGRWSPANAGGGYAGRIPMRLALTYSKNTVAARLINQVGSEAVRDFAGRAGVDSPIRNDLTIALGSSEVSLLEHTVGYATLARRGRHTEAVFFSRARDEHGTPIGEAGDPLGEGRRLPGSSDAQVIAAPVAAQLVDMLQSVVAHGTGRRAHVEGTPRAGKTGTTTDYVEGWFMGLTPKYTVGVWIGSKDRQSMGDREYGSTTALPAWVQIVEALHDPSPAFDFGPEVYFESWGTEVAALPRGELVDASAALPTFPNGG